MNTINKIAFVGDSFCMNAGQDHQGGHDDWPGIVAKELNAEIIQTGFGGQHLHRAIVEFLPKLYETDIIVMCVTEPFRLFNRHDLSINFTWVEQLKAKAGNHWELRHTTADALGMPLDKLFEVFNAAELYYEHLFDSDFVQFNNISCISFFDNLLKEHNKKVIWLPCFDQSFRLPSFWPPGKGDDRNKSHTKILPIINPHLISYNYIPISGPSGNISLTHLSTIDLQMSIPGLSEDRLNHLLKNDSRRNHFNIENNHKMATLILDIIKNDNFSPDVIKMEDYFTHMSLDHTLRVRL